MNPEKNAYLNTFVNRIVIAVTTLVFMCMFSSHAFSEDCSFSTTLNIDTALIIDSSGSMDDNDPHDDRLEAARFFIDQAEDDD